ncbi:MAG: GTPase Era [Elusimicrobiales bacterium]
MNGFRSGFAVIAGAPNAGKSTLLNRLAGGDLSIISPKPQTTRENIAAVRNGKNYQLVLVDTPGFLRPAYKLQDTMLHGIKRALREDADIVCFMAEPRPPGPKEKELAALVKTLAVPVFLAVNKTDTVSPAQAKTAAAEYEKLLSPAATHLISARRGDGVSALEAALAAALPEGEPYFPPGQWTDRWERFFAAEFAREQIFRLYGEEIPYACAAVTESFAENAKPPDVARIAVYVEKESQKPIIIGKGGAMIKRLREGAQKRLENFLGRPVRVEITVKVAKNWRADPVKIKQFYGER